MLRQRTYARGGGGSCAAGSAGPPRNQTPLERAAGRVCAQIPNPARSEDAAAARGAGGDAVGPAPGSGGVAVARARAGLLELQPTEIDPLSLFLET